MEHDIVKYSELSNKSNQEKPWMELLYREASDIHKLVELGNDLTNPSKKD